MSRWIVVAVACTVLAAACGADDPRIEVEDYPDAITRELNRLLTQPRPVDNSALPPRHLDADRFPESLVDRFDIVSGGPPPDGIPSVDQPTFQAANTVDWLTDTEPVLSFLRDGEARAYPLRLMNLHEIVNDVVAETPVVISYCPLSNSAVAFATDFTIYNHMYMPTSAKALAAERNFNVQVREPDVSPLAFQGPLAERLVAELFGTELVESLGFFHHTAVDLGGIPLVLCRSGWSKQGGFELFLTDGSRGIDLWDSVMAAGSPYGIGPGCPNNTERLESGLLSYASDTDGDTDPFEAGLGGFVNLEVEHEFIGKRALLAKQAVAGSLRQLVNVTVDGVPPICEHPWTARLDGERVGQVRNLTWSPRLGRAIGVALLRADATSTGTMLDVDADGHPLRARVSATRFGVVN